jgi:hypothetical protein
MDKKGGLRYRKSVLSMCGIFERKYVTRRFGGELGMALQELYPQLEPIGQEASFQMR